jgi:hypothetical protein
MTDFELKNSDPEDIEDLLAKVEKSFNIKFVGNELTGLLTFGDLCDHITNKIQLGHSDNCTTQQAFYKLRKAISTAIGNDDIRPHTLLSDILPRRHRLSTVRQIENKLGFKLSFLRPRHFVTGAFVILLLVSFIWLFISWKVGLTGLFVSIAGQYIADKFGKETDIKTVGELTEKMTRENYQKSRRDSTTFNRNEIENILTEWFSKDLYVDKSKLTRDAEFFI